MSKLDIEPSKPVIPSAEELMDKLREEVIGKAKLKVEYSKLLDKYAKYRAMELEFGLSDRINMLRDYWDKLSFIIEISPKLISIAFAIAKIINTLNNRRVT